MLRPALLRLREMHLAVDGNVAIGRNQASAIEECASSLFCKSADEIDVMLRGNLL